LDIGNLEIDEEGKAVESLSRSRNTDVIFNELADGLDFGGEELRV
jgi:hypothetical protein